MDIVIVLSLILVMVGFNALYVGAEFATVGSRRSRVQETAEKGSGSASGLLAILRDPKRLDNYVAACQIGITLSSIVAGAYGQAQLVPLLEDRFGSASPTIAVVTVLLFITSLQVVLGELLPKTIALRYPETLAIATLPPMRISQWLLRPLVAVFNGSAFAIMRRLGLNIELRDARGDMQWRQQLLAEGGRLQVPCLYIPQSSGDAQWLYESDDIIAYLEERFADRTPLANH